MMQPESPAEEIVFGIDFMVPPAIGTVLMYDKQAFVAEGIEPYTRKDGGQLACPLVDAVHPVRPADQRRDGPAG